LSIVKPLKGDWYKTFVYLLTSEEGGKEDDKENRIPLREALVSVTSEGIVIVCAKSLFMMYSWDLDLLHQWKMPNPKTLIAYFGIHLSEAVVFKSSNVKQIVTLLTSYTSNLPISKKI